MPNFLHVLPILNENSLSVLPTVGLLNPYGLWSPRHSQSDVSSSEMEFGTARQYDTTDLDEALQREVICLDIFNKTYF